MWGLAKISFVITIEIEELPYLVSYRVGSKKIILRKWVFTVRLSKSVTGQNQRATWVAACVAMVFSEEQGCVHQARGICDVNFSA